MRQLSRTLMTVLLWAGFCAIAHAGEFRILLVDQLPEEALRDQPTGRVMICGGWADGLVEGQKGSIYKPGAVGTFPVATVVLAAVDEHESVCEFTAPSRTAIVTRQLVVRMDSLSLTLPEVFEKATVAFDASDYRRALHYYEQVVQQDSSNDMAAIRIPMCRTAIEREATHELSAAEREAERARIPEYLEIGHACRSYRLFGRAHAYVNKVLRVDSANAQALALRGMMPDTIDYLPSSAAGATSQNDIQVGSFDVASRMIQYSEPVYPPAAKAAGKKGAVIVKVLVDANGSVRRAEVSTSSNDSTLDRAALEAAPYWKYRPATNHGIPVASWTTHAVTFGGTELGLAASVSPDEYLPGKDEFVDVDAIAVMTYEESPVYPRSAQSAGAEGTVWLKALVGTDGTVKEIVVAKSSGNENLDQSALAAGAKCRFKPAEKDGVPRAMWVAFKYSFRLGW